jgi:large conductance mechanosensitive channel
MWPAWLTGTQTTQGKRGVICALELAKMYYANVPALRRGGRRKNCSSQYSIYTLGEHMSIASEFKEFALKGNVMDLAVGVIIGAAFGKIVDSVVNDLIMPLIGKVTGGLDFSNYYLPLNGQPAGLPLAEAKKAGAVFAYGNFITVLIYFIILAFIIFLMIKQVNKLKKDVPPPPVGPPEDVLLLRQIRDSLKK